LRGISAGANSPSNAEALRLAQAATMGTPRKPGGGFSVLSAFASVLPSASGASASSSSSTPTTAATAAASTNPNAGPNQQAASSLAPPPAGRGVTTAPGMPSPVTGLTEKVCLCRPTYL